MLSAALRRFFADAKAHRRAVGLVDELVLKHLPLPRIQRGQAALQQRHFVRAAVVAVVGHNGNGSDRKSVV